jgi:hypothetical protein
MQRDLFWCQCHHRSTLCSSDAVPPAHATHLLSTDLFPAALSHFHLRSTFPPASVTQKDRKLGTDVSNVIFGTRRARRTRPFTLHGMYPERGKLLDSGTDSDISESICTSFCSIHVALSLQRSMPFLQSNRRRTIPHLPHHRRRPTGGDCGGRRRSARRSADIVDTGRCGARTIGE